MKELVSNFVVIGWPTLISAVTIASLWACGVVEVSDGQVSFAFHYGRDDVQTVVIYFSLLALLLWLTLVLVLFTFVSIMIFGLQ